MCGITGFVDFNKKLSKDLLIQMTDSLEHRGPDASGYEMLESAFSLIGLGHRRLSIIDLSEGGAQPKTKDNITISFNGEIYNYQEIKSELITLGHKFSSSSDTEVIISAYKEWGIEAIQKFIGMFAFVLYDKKAEQFYIVRDRAGVKPLYYYYENDTLLFASELKGLLASNIPERKIDKNSLGLYFTYGYIPTPYSIYEKISKVKQGHYYVLDLKSKKIQTKKYWDVFDYAVNPPQYSGEEELLSKTEKIITSSCNYRMVSDVPVGVFLSGGYDSSLVTALLQKDRTEKINTFTIGFEDKEYDESGQARLVAEHLGTNHTEWTCTIKEAKETIHKIPEICDEPMGDNSIIPTYLVCKMAKQQVNVALSADGGDEQFIGYRRHINAIKIAEMVNKIPPILSKSIGNIGSKIYSPHSRYGKIASILEDVNPALISLRQNMSLSSLELKQLLTPAFQTNIPFPFLGDGGREINNLFATEYIHYMQDDIMVKVDRAAMAVSLEGREPLLDHRIAEFIMGVPYKEKYKNQTLKYLLKSIVHKYIPKSIMEKPKHGFSIPFASWLKHDFGELLDYYLDPKRIKQQGLFSSQFINEKIKALRERDCKRSSVFIWHMLIFQMWYERWMPQT